MKAEQYDEAIKMLEKIVARCLKQNYSHINLAIRYGQDRYKPKQKAAALKKALELIAGHPVASNEYGFTLPKAGRFVRRENNEL